MSFHYNVEQHGVDGYRNAAVSFLEDWSYRHLDWRIHKFSKVCPVCLSIKLNREMLEDLKYTKSPSLELDDEDIQEEPAES